LPRLRDTPPAELGPYLLQHRDNPVNWWSWGDDAFEEARLRDRPVLLSIGYSSCHWCHVMAHESFEDDAIAATMNEQFVNIKVDREERPDVDAIYMQAVVGMTGRGGWPMTMFLDADGRPFFGGTYFPNEDRGGMNGFPRVLAAIDDAWNTHRDELTEQAEKLSDALARAGSAMAGDGTPLDREFLDAAVTAIAAQFDAQNGGFGRAPKFPQAMTHEFLATQYARHPRAETLQIITTSLDAMAAGGMHDQLGGGFARYSVDDHWLVPHFEKMLYDQALLLRAYTAGYLVTKNPRYREVATDIVDYVRRDLAGPGGGFASAEDADSEGVEGKFYCWSVDEIRSICGPDADAVIAFYGVSARGNFVDPHTGFTGAILFRAVADRPPDDAVQRGSAALLAARNTRVRPGLDAKVLLAWNALFVAALLDAAAAFDEPAWHTTAIETTNFLLRELRNADGRFLRAWQAGHARHLAVAEDYAALLDALVACITHDGPRWLPIAREVADDLLRLFADADGPGFFTVGDDAPPLIVRAKDFEDNATPSENSLAAHALWQLARITDDERYRAAATAIVESVATVAARHPTAFAHALRTIDMIVGPSAEVAIIGARNAPETNALRAVINESLRPGVLAIVGDPSATEGAGPLFEGRGLVQGQPAAYVCEHFTCRLPVTTPAALEEELSGRG
jgi:uncharacterized protein YyaL (SSP411 family)